MIIVIADDITGAAEIAGIALKHGLDTVLTTELSIPIPRPEVLVMATDTRSGIAADAEQAMKEAASVISGSGDCLLFKKTDSVLRGHITAELAVLMKELDFDNALLIPQNPSKGRIIKGGRYYIGGVDLDKTDFKSDPEFPAYSSSVKELLKGKTETLGLATPLEPAGRIFIADAGSREEINMQLDKAVSGKTLPAGGADLFTAILEHKNRKTASPATRQSIPASKKVIVVCGSTQSKNITEEPYIRETGACEEIMPYDVFRGASPEEWISRMVADYEKHKSIIVSIGDKENGGKDCAIRLRSIMAAAVNRLVNKERPELIIIEGGATAYAILSSIGWSSFKLKNEYAPGIVSMTYGNTEIILKPGSYPWGNLFK